MMYDNVFAHSNIKNKQNIKWWLQMCSVLNHVNVFISDFLLGNLIHYRHRKK